MFEAITKTLRATADKLRANMDSAEGKQLALALIFVKYISGTFHAKRAELARRFADPADEYFLPDSTPALRAGELEDRDCLSRSQCLLGAGGRALGVAARRRQAA